MRILTITFFCCFIYATSYSQVNFSGYTDFYIAHDNDNSRKIDGQPYRLFSFMDGKKNEFSLNIVNLAMDAKFDKVYGRISLHYGDLPAQAWTGPYPAIQEAYAGVILSESFSIDAGYFLTHIGNEALLPKNNLLTSHSMVTFMEPFYHAGVRANWQVSEKFKATFLLINSMWNYVNTNENFGLGMSLFYGDDGLNVSYSGAIANESIPGISTDIYNNVNFSYKGGKTQLKVQFDLYSQIGESIKDRHTFGVSLTSHMGFNFIENLSGTARFSYVDNINGTVFTLPATTMLEVAAGFEYKPSTNSYIRIEQRVIEILDDNYLVFRNDEGRYVSMRGETLLNFGFWFDTSDLLK